MENHSPSELSISSENNIECLHLQDQSVKESSGKELSGGQHATKDNAKPELLLDLRNLSTTCGDNIENDDSSMEFSMITGQPIGQSSIADLNSVSERDNDDPDTKHVLQARIRSLQELMSDLRDSLHQEVALWKKEKEEFQILREKSDYFALEEATAAARAAAAAYAAESPLSSDLVGDVFDITSEETLRELTILEYEKKLAKYQDEFSLTQAEKRYNTRWQLVAQAYKQKLMEVERLCNEELDKVRRSADHVQELKDMTSQWYHTNNRGDSPDNFVRTQRDKIFTEDTLNMYRNYRKLDGDMNMSEIYSARYKSDDVLKQDCLYGHI